MFPKATSGTDSNNRKFSTCSIDYISPVLETKADQCFQSKYQHMNRNSCVDRGGCVVGDSCVVDEGYVCGCSGGCGF